MFPKLYPKQKTTKSWEAHLKKHGMTTAEYDRAERTGVLSPEQVKNGWRFSTSFDGLLVHKSDQEARIDQKQSGKAKGKSKQRVEELRGLKFKPLSQEPVPAKSTFLDPQNLHAETPINPLNPDITGSGSMTRIKLPDGRMIPLRRPPGKMSMSYAAGQGPAFTAGLVGKRFMQSKAGGPLGMLGALLGGAAAGVGLGAIKKYRNDYAEEEARSRADLEKQAHRDALQMMQNRENKLHIQNSIDQNLMRLQSEAPDLYMRIAAGRTLPSGAVVIGGSVRNDLLQELGAGMSNAQYN